MNLQDFTSNRIYLRRIKETDADSVYSYRSLPEVARYHYWDPFTKGRAAEFAKQGLNVTLEQKDQWIDFAVINKETEEFIGDAALKITGNSAEVGYTVSPKYQKQGYGKEGIKLLINYCFKRGIKTVFGVVDSENTASIKLMESMGMKRDFSYEERMMLKGLLSIEHKYSITKEEWDKRYETKV